MLFHCDPDAPDLGGEPSTRSLLRSRQDRGRSVTAILPSLPLPLGRPASRRMNPYRGAYRESRPIADRARSNALAARSPARLAPSARMAWTDPGF